MICYQNTVKKLYQIKVGDVKELIPSLGNNTNYVLHCRNLQLYLSLGMKLTKIHRVLKFKQSEWMKKCIDFNTEKRINTANDFELDFFQINNQFCLRKNNRNFSKKNQRAISK